MNLNGTVKLFKELGQFGRATDMIKSYIDGHGGNRDVFDLARYPFAANIDEPEIVAAFDNKFSAMKIAREPAVILLSIAKSRGWNQADISTLSTLPVEEYYSIFKTYTGSNLHQIINACLQFDGFVDAPESQKEISMRAREALKRIGRESKINARRVMKYGIQLN